MLKKILISTFATLIVGAASVSAYNNATSPTTVSAQSTEEITAQNTTQNTTQERVSAGQSQSQGQGYGQDTAPEDGQVQSQGGGGYRGGRGDTDTMRGNNAESASLNPDAEQTTLHGIVTQIEPALVTLSTDEGNSITISLDVATLGIPLTLNDSITLSGHWNLDGTFAAGQITLDATGETYPINGNGNSGKGYRGGGNGGGGGGGRRNSTNS